MPTPMRCWMTSWAALAGGLLAAAAAMVVLPPKALREEQVDSQWAAAASDVHQRSRLLLVTLPVTLCGWAAVGGWLEGGQQQQLQEVRWAQPARMWQAGLGWVAHLLLVEVERGAWIGGQSRPGAWGPGLGVQLE